MSAAEIDDVRGSRAAACGGCSRSRSCGCPRFMRVPSSRTAASANRVAAAGETLRRRDRDVDERAIAALARARTSAPRTSASRRGRRPRGVRRAARPEFDVSVASMRLPRCPIGQTSRRGSTATSRAGAARTGRRISPIASSRRRNVASRSRSTGAPAIVSARRARSAAAGRTARRGRRAGVALQS